MLYRIIFFFVLATSQSYACVSSPCTVTDQASLAAAITYANGQATTTIINVTADITLTNGTVLPTLLSNITINGNNKTITGANTLGFNRIFSIGANFVATNFVTMSNLTLTGGYALGGTGLGGGLGAGGAIYVNSSANVTATNLVFTNNTARGGYGGDVQTNGGTISTNNSVVGAGTFGEGGGLNSAGGYGGGGGTNSNGGFSSGNGNATRGGGGAGLGGAIFVRDGGVFIINNTIDNAMSGNSSWGGLGAQNGQGGADGIFLQGDGTLRVSTAAGTTTTYNNAIADQTGGNAALIAAGLGAIPNFTAGSYSLVKSGTGTLVINNALAIAGGTRINEGRITINTTGLLLGNIEIASGANLTSNSALARDLTQNITGEGSVTQSGTGILYLTGTNTYSGGTNLNAGTISITSDAQLGAATGRLNFNGGTLLTNFGAGSSRSGTIGLAGGTIIGSHPPQTFSGVFSNGAMAGGSLTLRDGSGFTFTGDNTYTGTTIVNGTLLSLGNGGATGSVAGNISLINGSELTFNRNNTLVYGGVISGDGTIVQNNAAGTTILTANNTYSGNYTSVNAGSLQLGNNTTTGSVLGDITIGNGANLITNRSDNFTLTNAISGAGNYIQAGSGVVTMTAAQTYYGNTSVNAGTLLVNHTFGNPGAFSGSPLVTVGTGGTLGGVGTLNNVTNNGIVNPGNTAGTSIGTMNIAGNFVNNSNLVLDITTGSNDYVNITGANVTLGGTLVLRPTGGGFTAGQTIHLLNTMSAGNLAGSTFANIQVVGSFGALRPVISYANDDVSITLAQASVSSLLTAPVSTNTINTALAIDAMILAGGSSPIFDALFNLPGAQLAGAIAQLSGEIGNTSKQAGLATGNLFMRSMHDPFNAMLCVSNCDGGNVVLREMAGNKASVTRALPVSRGKWFGWSTIDVGQKTTKGGNTTTITPISAATGLEYRMNDRVAYGFALSGGSAGYRIENGLGSGTNNSALLGVYGRFASGDYLLSASLFTGWQGVETKRNVTVGAISENLGGETNGLSFGSRVELSRRFGFISPYAALQAQTMRLNGYSEKGIDGSAATAALTYGAQTAHSVRSELGLGGEYELAAGTRLNARIGWAHEFANAVSTQAAFKGGFAFQTTGATALRDSLLLKSGFEHNLSPSLRVKAGLTGEFSGQSRVLAADASLKWAW